MKTISNFDRKLIENIAELWIDSGGDSVGFGWTWTNIKERIEDMEKERDRLNQRLKNERHY